MELKEKVYRLLNEESLFETSVESAVKKIAKKLEVSNGAVIQALNQLKKRNRIDIFRDGIKDRSAHFKGVYKSSFKSEFGRVVCNNGKEYLLEEKVFAVEGDVVEVGFYFENGNQKPFIYSVVERKNEIIIGHVEIAINGQYVFIPDNKKFGQIINIPQNDSTFEAVGKKCTIKLYLDKKLESEPFGVVDRIFGLIGDPIIENQAIAHSKGFTKYFSLEIDNEVCLLPNEVKEEDFIGREDFRNLNFFTIDPATAKDLDDAIAIERLDDGYRIYVAIADVSHYVEEDSLVDQEAYKRGTSCYLGDGVYPMLPEKLSNGICSLNEKIDRCALCAIVDIDNAGNMTNYDLKKVVINSRHKLSYEVAEKIHNSEDGKHLAFSDIKPDLDLMYEAAEILQENRLLRGSIDFDRPQISFKFDDTFTKVLEVVDKSGLTSTGIVESFMILANEAVGHFFTEKQMGVLYRIHEIPKDESIMKMCNKLKALGYDVVCNFKTGKDVQRLIDEFKDSEIKDYALSQILKSMQRARYSPENYGHYGLASPAYIHFTSPIRRYPDLLAHRLITYYLDNNPVYMDAEVLARMGYHLSEQERKAQEAETMSNKLLCAMWAEQHIGENISGYINGIYKDGLSVRSGLVDVFVPKKELRDGKYGYSIHKHGSMYINEMTDYAYTIGDRIDLRIMKADINDRRILGTTDEHKLIIKPEAKQNEIMQEEMEN